VVVALQAIFWAGQRWAEPGMCIYQPVNWTMVAAMVAFWTVAQAALRRRESRPVAATTSMPQAPAMCGRAPFLDRRNAL
jgi:hypothetical protein